MVRSQREGLKGAESSQVAQRTMWQAGWMTFSLQGGHGDGSSEGSSKQTDRQTHRQTEVEEQPCQRSRLSRCVYVR